MVSATPLTRSSYHAGATSSGCARRGWRGAAVGISFGRDGMARPDQERAVQAEGGGGVGGGEDPAGIDRLHDLEAMRHPADAVEERGLGHSGVGRGDQAEDDLGLDARLGQAGEGEAAAGRRAGRARCRHRHGSTSGR
jgi:hypothetical protein